MSVSDMEEGSGIVKLNRKESSALSTLFCTESSIFFLSRRSTDTMLSIWFEVHTLQVMSNLSSSNTSVRLRALLQNKYK